MSKCFFDLSVFFRQTAFSLGSQHIHQVSMQSVLPFATMAKIANVVKIPSVKFKKTCQVRVALIRTGGQT